jgi:hypothetical protein
MGRQLDSYVQRLQDFDISLESATERTPDRTQYHVFVGDQLVGSFKRIKDAQTAFRQAATDAGWRPSSKERDPGEILAREREAQDRAAYEDYWGSATSFRRSGRPRRRQR